MATTSAIESKNMAVVSGSGAEKEEPIGQVDHGVRAWTVVLGAWCCLFCGFGWVNGETENRLLHHFPRLLRLQMT